MGCGLLVINFYLDNVFLITVTIISLAIFIPLLGMFILKQQGSTNQGKLYTKDRDFLVHFSTALLMAGLVIPVVIAFIVKMIPDFIEDAAPKAGYFIIALSIWLIFINIKRFKFIEKSKLIDSKNVEEARYLEKRMSKYKFDMILIVIFIIYMIILFNL